MLAGELSAGLLQLDQSGGAFMPPELGEQLAEASRLVRELRDDLLPASPPTYPAWLRRQLGELGKGD